MAATREITLLLWCTKDDDVPDVADDLLDLLVAVVLTPALADLLLLAKLRAVLGDILLVLLPQVLFTILRCVFPNQL